MARDVPSAGLQLEENFVSPFDHLPTQAFILDLSNDVLEGMIESASKGNEICLALGNKPTFLYASSSHHIEPTFEDNTDDIELFLTDADGTLGKAERLPQLAMSLFRKPDLNGPWPYFRTGFEEDEEEEFYEEIGSSSEWEDLDQQSSEELDEDVALLRTSLAQKEVEKMEKSTRVAPAATGKPNAKRAVSSMGSMQKALSGRHSPFGRASLSPHPSPSLSAVRSPSLAPVDAASREASERTRKARSPIVHELAFKEQPYDILWQKYPGSSETEFRNALDSVADLDVKTQNYTLRRKYWRELDAWEHEYESDEERQQAIENAIRQYDKMRLSTNEPEWERLLRKDERGQGRILSKIQATIAKGPTAPKVHVQKADDLGADSGSSSGSSTKDDSSGNVSGGSHADDEGADSDAGHSPPSRQSSAAATAAAAARRTKARELQEKRLLSTTKKTPTPSPSPKVSPIKAAASRASSEKQTKYKSKEFISDSETTDSESESVPLASAMHHQPRQSGPDTKQLAAARKVATASAKTTSPSPTARDPLQRSADTADAATASLPRNTESLSPKESMKWKATTKSLPKTLPKKRVREQEDDDSSSSSSSGTPLSKRIRPLSRPAPKAFSARDPEKLPQPASRPSQQPPSRGANSLSSSSSSSSGGSSNGSRIGNGHTSVTSNGTAASSTKQRKIQNSPIKSSPLAASPPTNASDLDLSSEESVPPIGNSNTSKKRKFVEDRRNNLMAADTSSNRLKKRRPLPNDLVDKALRFKTYYEKYLALYKEVSSRPDQPKEKVNDLLRMHNRLQDMKNNIHNEAMVARA